MIPIGANQSTNPRTDNWLTPPEIIRALGPFDLDPCAAPNQPWRTAAIHYVKNGLQRPWAGRVWLNPPYGRETEKWIKRLAIHGDGIALIFARTETKIFHPWVWLYADAIFFFKGRLNFYTPDGIRSPHNAGAPSVLVAYGPNNGIKFRHADLWGHFVDLKGNCR